MSREFKLFPSKGPPNNHRIEGWFGFAAVWTFLRRCYSLFSYRGSNHDNSVTNPQSRHCTEYAKIEWLREFCYVDEDKHNFCASSSFSHIYSSVVSSRRPVLEARSQSTRTSGIQSLSECLRSLHAFWRLVF
jgi:hypothetical protein